MPADRDSVEFTDFCKQAKQPDAIELACQPSQFIGFRLGISGKANIGLPV